MSGKVHQFLNESGGNNFTEMTPRPPVPGEETEIQSNGGISTKSSGSLKSYISGKSHSSSAVSQRSETNYSPAATPRKSSRDKTKQTNSQGTSTCPVDCNEDEVAPLGFEPEGSVSNSPPFHENDTPPYLRWARSFKYLMEDGDGVELFKRFLDDEGCDTNSLNFWFACQGLKTPQNSKKVPHMIKVINRIYINCDRNLKISSETRKQISDKLSKQLSQPDSDIFTSAQEEVESYLRDNAYQAFLKSDVYLEYVQCQGKSPKSSEASSGSNSVRPASGALPPLLEDSELANESLDHSISFNSTSSKLVTSFTHPAEVLVTPKLPRKTEAVGTNTSSRSNRGFYPIHQTYAPVSAQDSELQSLSSDAPTDDTMSLTDGSVDAIPANPKAWKNYRRSVQRKAQRNPEGKNSNMHETIIPRTDHAPKDRNIAETNPTKFASLLVEKLLRVQQELSREEKMRESLRKCESEVDEERGANTKPSAAATLITYINHHTSFNEEFNADSILEEHCSRVWSTGQQSPLSKSPERIRKPAAISANTTFPSLHGMKAYHRNAKRDRDMMSQSYMDDSDPHKHHHHHHSTRKRYDPSVMTPSQDTTSQSRYYPVDQMSKSYMDTPLPVESSDSRSRSMYKKLNPRKTSDSSGGVDSGFSISGDSGAVPVPNAIDPNYSKVMQWIMASENVPTGTTTNTDSDKSSSNKRSTVKFPATSLSVISQPNKLISSRIIPQAGTTQSSWLHSGTVVPSQPFVQDPSMPLLNPPNTVTQLEEAKRRLETEARATHSPPKSRSFSGLSQSKDPRVGSSFTSQAVLSTTLPHTNTVPNDLNLSGGVNSSFNSQHNTSIDRKPARRSVSTVVPTQSVYPNLSVRGPDMETVIGYYFCGDPIPFRHVVKNTTVTLAVFKRVTGKRGYRYFFKKASDEFGSGAIFEEITDESEVLPLFEGKIHARVERDE